MDIYSGAILLSLVIYIAVGNYAGADYQLGQLYSIYHVFGYTRCDPDRHFDVSSVYLGCDAGPDFPGAECGWLGGSCTGPGV